jgi:hypothetical protein
MTGPLPSKRNTPLDRGIAGAEVKSDSIVFFSVGGFGSVETVGVASVAALGASAISIPLSGTGKLGEDSTESAGSDGRAGSAAVECFAAAGRLGE